MKFDDSQNRQYILATGIDVKSIMMIIVMKIMII